MDKTGLQKRIKNIQGQLEGIIRMMDNSKACIDVLTQFKAVRAGLDKAAAVFAQEYLLKCIGTEELSKSKRAEVEKIIFELSRN